MLSILRLGTLAVYALNVESFDLKNFLLSFKKERNIHGRRNSKWLRESFLAACGNVPKKWSEENFKFVGEHALRFGRHR